MSKFFFLALVVFCLVRSDMVFAQTSPTRAGDWEKIVEAG